MNKNLKYVPKANWLRYYNKYKNILVIHKKFKTNSNYGYHFFKSLKYNGNFYPRLHIVVMMSLIRRNNFVKIDAHVDYDRHHTDQFHAAVDQIYKELHNI